jgi:hypothetical protein
MDSWIDSGFNYFILNSSLRFSVTHSTDIYSSQIKKKSPFTDSHLQWQPNLAQQQGKPLMQGTLTPEGISCWDSARWFSYPQLAAIQNILWPRCWLLPTRQKAGGQTWTTITFVVGTLMFDATATSSTVEVATTAVTPTLCKKKEFYKICCFYFKIFFFLHY